eukprot:16436987-Heterocapsa_arctica.AAC.1
MFPDRGWLGTTGKHVVPDCIYIERRSLKHYKLLLRRRRSRGAEAEHEYINNIAGKEEEGQGEGKGKQTEKPRRTRSTTGGGWEA